MGYAIEREGDGALIGPFPWEEQAREFPIAGRVVELMHPWEALQPGGPRWWMDGHEADAMWTAFGKAMAQAQALEQALLITRQAAGLIQGEPRLMGDARWEFLEGNRETMGKKLYALKDAVSMPDELFEQLRSALDVRNDLAHHYFVGRRALRALDREGIAAMIGELHQAHEALTDATARCFAFLGTIMEQGWDETTLAELRSMWDELLEGGTSPEQIIANLEEEE